MATIKPALVCAGWLSEFLADWGLGMCLAAESMLVVMQKMPLWGHVKVSLLSPIGTFAVFLVFGSTQQTQSEDIIAHLRPARPGLCLSSCSACQHLSAHSTTSTVSRE